MTPEEKQQLDDNTQATKDLTESVNRLLEYMEQRQQQQISVPLDDASKAVLGVAIIQGPGNSTLTQNIAVPGTTPPSSINVPKAYTATILIQGNDGVVYEVPILQTI